MHPLGKGQADSQRKPRDTICILLGCQDLVTQLSGTWHVRFTVDDLKGLFQPT